jgi:hypothetical protein
VKQGLKSYFFENAPIAAVYLFFLSIREGKREKIKGELDSILFNKFEINSDEQENR